MTKIAGSGSISQRHGFADQDPDPDQHQNVMDPQHWEKLEKLADEGKIKWLSSLFFIPLFLIVLYLQVTINVFFQILWKLI